jgi:ADP-ribose pyrophosphatase YjhB (NUDIX family)
MAKEKTFCCFCGKSTDKKEIEDKLRLYCTECGTVFYENPLPVASSIVVNEKREVLLVRRMKDPYRDMWCLPIGFAETGEEVKDAALRELKEEAGVEGEIIKLIDVDTVDNYFYGSLAIVTYEVKMTGGEVKPGDDASDAAWFPINKIPKLAWESNEKAIAIYIDQYKEFWAMIDSFDRLAPDRSGMSAEAIREGQSAFLSNILINLIEKDKLLITENWMVDLRAAGFPFKGSEDILRSMNMLMLESVMKSLRSEDIKAEYGKFLALGGDLSGRDIDLPLMLTAISLSRKNIWVHVIRNRIVLSPLEIYATLELNNRIIYIYDRINFFIAKGYTGAVK